jgi:hypothetical protein
VPLHPACAHVQSISGVFSMASHWVLQYLPDVVMHEQTGWAHFSAFAVVISILPPWDPKWRIQAQNNSHSKNLRLYRSAHIAVCARILPIGIGLSRIHQSLRRDLWTRRLWLGDQFLEKRPVMNHRLA